MEINCIFRAECIQKDADSIAVPEHEIKIYMELVSLELV